MGFGLREYKGRKIVRHFGAMPGFVSMFFLVPEEKLGIAILTNGDSQEAMAALHFQLLDRYLGGRSADWIESFHAAARRPAAHEAAPAPSGIKPPPLEACDGEYVDPSYGSVTINLEGGKHVVRFSRTPALTGEIERGQGDSLVVRWQDRTLDSDAYVTFTFAADGTPAGMKLTPLSSEGLDFSQLSFVRK